MGRRGRKPLPNKLKVLNGNPGRRPMNNDEPQPAPGAPKAPDWLDPLAREEWDRVVPVLDATGVLTKVDGFILEAYCTCYAFWRKAQGKVSVLGEVFVPTNQKGSRYLQQNPYFSVAMKYLNQSRVFASELGLSPASRARLVSPNDDLDDDPLEQFFRERKRKQ